MNLATEKAIKLAGSQSKLAKVLGITPQALGQQLQAGKILPHHCIAIEQKYPQDISRYDLDPEHFGSRECVVIVLENYKVASTTI